LHVVVYKLNLQANLQMSAKRTHVVSRLLIPIVLIFGFTSCAEIRKVTYPKNFVWLGDAEVKTVMHRFSNSMVRIDEAAQRKNPGDKVLIIEELEEMIDLAESIMANGSAEPGGVIRTNHLLIDEHIGAFLTDLTHAKSQMEIQPESYYLVGNLTGKCSGCHQYR